MYLGALQLQSGSTLLPQGLCTSLVPRHLSVMLHSGVLFQAGPSLRECSGYPHPPLLSGLLPVSSFLRLRGNWCILRSVFTGPKAERYVLFPGVFLVPG